MFDEIKRTTTLFYERNPQCFTASGPQFIDMPDNHSVAIVSSHLGRPLHNITQGQYEVYDVTPQINSEPLVRYKDAMAIFEGII